MIDYESFRQILSPLGLPPISRRAYGQLAVYAQMLCEKNKVTNLTAIRDEDEVWVRHFADSLAVYAAQKSLPDRLIDVGCGAGFPGLPLKILADDLRGNSTTALTLLDATRKKIDFLAEVCAELRLENVAPVNARAEELAADKAHREQYDWAVSRAVADLRILAELSLPFVRVGGKFVPHKSDRSDEEIDAAKGAIAKLGGRLTDQHVYTISPDAPSSRVLTIVKHAASPAEFPRAYARIKAKPLR